jgi:cytochrome b6-f complex iron-sulfur subunit
MKGLARFVEDLLRQRRPKPFPVDEADADALRAAIELRAAHPGAGLPREEFVTGLRRRLGETVDEPATRTAKTSPALYTRRGVLRGASTAAAGIAVGAGVDHVVTTRAQQGSGQVGTGAAPQTVLTPNTGIWQTVAAGTELPEGGVRAFDAGTVAGFVMRTDGGLRAVSGICTHQGCRLALDAPTHQLRCPCHRAAFALTGEVTQHQFAAAPRPLPHLQVRQDGEAIQVFIPPGPGATPSPSSG